MGEPHEFSVNAYLSAKNVGLFGIAIAALYYVGAGYRLYQRETSLVGGRPSRLDRTTSWWGDGGQLRITGGGRYA